MTNIVGNRTLRQLLEYRARTTPQRLFVIFDDLQGNTTRLSYAEFDAQVNRAANMLRTLGIEHNDKINLHLPNCLEFLYLWFGAAKIGAVIMPTNVAASADELEYLVNHSESRLIFTAGAHFDVVEDARRRCTGVEGIVVCDRSVPHGVKHLDFHALVEQQKDVAPPAKVGPLDEAAIMYTSGTTARPKGVLVTHANYIYAGETVAKAIRLAPEDRHFVVMPLFHGNAQYYSTMSALVVGASIVVMGRFSASRYFDKCIEHQCTVTSLFAAPIRMLLAQPRKPEHRNNRLRVVIYAQNITEAQLGEWHERFGAPLLQLWGMTETMGPPLMNPIEFERRNMSMGLPVMGYEVAIVDESGQPLPAGQTGQIVVRGDPGWTLMKGYFKNPEATAETLRQGWLWSGDNAHQDKSGYFHFVDRAKDMIKRAGENVAASEVEAVILQHPKVFDCAVIGVADQMRDERIKAVVVAREGQQLEAEEIISWCHARLAKFRVPELVEFRRELPRTSVGKIQKHILRRESIAPDK
jgi:crotonobetaine/carnitine-CoA ligase